MASNHDSVDPSALEPADGPAPGSAMRASERPVRHFRIFVDAAAILGTRADDDEAAIARIAGVLVPRMADCCVIDLADERGVVQRIAAVHFDRDKHGLAGALPGCSPGPDTPVGGSAAARAGVLQVDVDDAWLVDAARDDDHLRILRALEPRSIIIVPLEARGCVLGSISVALTRAARRYGPTDLELMLEIGRHAARAVDSARLLAEARASRTAEQRARQEAEQASRAQDELLGLVSHELRTPLAAIVGWANLLRGKAGDAALVTKGLAVIERNARAQVTLIEDLLEASRPPAAEPALDPELRETASIAGLRVLVVDDDLDTRDVVRATLETSGAVVRAAGSAEEAIRVIDEFGPDVLLSDIGMPGEDGLSMLARLRASPSPHAGVPAIALSAFARDGDAQRARAAGFQALLAKPADGAVLCAALAGAHRGQRAPG